MMNQNGFATSGSGGMMGGGGGGNDQLSASNNSGSAMNGLAGMNNNLNNANSVTAFLRSGAGGNQAAMQGMMAGMAGIGNMGSMGGTTVSNAFPNMNSMMAAMNSNSNSNSQAQNSVMNLNNMNNFSFDHLKRLQQMAQLQQQASMMPQSGMQDPSTALLQTYLDQKIQTSRFGDLGAMGGLQAMQGQNPMLGAGGTNLLMMNQGNLGGNFNVGGNTSDTGLPSPHSLFHRDGSRRMRGGVIEPFPEKLHRLLLEVEAAGRADVISFVAGGRAFAIHKPEKFFKEIVPLYFRQSRLSSFKRQLNLYGFELINTGPARGGYYHELFVKDRPELCRRMRRVAVKVTPKDSDPSDVSKEKESKPQLGGNKNEVTKEKVDDDVVSGMARGDSEEVGGGLSHDVKTPEVVA
ncbi:HSF-type DNA-binding protein [Nitzschia inconspicua]|uniref:HSF-type DNA-binding protein n=1 Tax=Nitzschia inconspicua TaxID=303405 RepID=A0A9K3PRA6_9STRA|nr:HSF-type DNA-binding protein [Nitzschia inconspicua]